MPSLACSILHSLGTVWGCKIVAITDPNWKMKLQSRKGPPSAKAHSSFLVVFCLLFCFRLLFSGEMCYHRPWLICLNLFSHHWYQAWQVLWHGRSIKAAACLGDPWHASFPLLLQCLKVSKGRLAQVIPFALSTCWEWTNLSCMDV